MERPHVATGSIQDRGPRLVHKRNVATRRILRVWAFIQIGDGRGRQIDASCTTAPRSEERRVGKECRSRWSPKHKKKKRKKERITRENTTQSSNTLSATS